jgi:hypothetical protein
MKPVGILGSGPAGLMAAWACTLVGLPVVVISKNGRSRLGGAQFLHAPIPGMHKASEPETVVRYVRRGDPEEYRRKAFGAAKLRKWKPWTEGGQPDERAAWSLDAAYERLWTMYGDCVETNKQEITGKWLDDHKDDFQFIISSVPLQRLCLGDHTFATQLVQIHPVGFEQLDDDTVLYDGTKDRSWYRTSNIFNTTHTEWGEGQPAPRGLEPLYRDYKPMWTNCECWSDHQDLLLVGRRGRWSADDFSHDAFYDTMTALGMRYGRL